MPPFVPRLPWLGGDLQTVRNVLCRSRAELGGFARQTLMLPTRDGSGDVLQGSLHHPETAVGKPLVILIHGLTGCEDSSYILATARHFLARGWPVLRLNLRGAGPTRRHCRRRYHAGRSDDLRDALAALPSGLKAHGVMAIGYSLGGNMLLKFLGEEGAAAPVGAAVSVSSPIDLAGSARRFVMLRNSLYHRWLLARLKAESDGPAADLSPHERAAIAAARTVIEFDGGVVAPRNGFSGAEDYYRRCSARRFLDTIRVPTLVIHARNDPWIPPDPYLDFDWSSNPLLTPLLPYGGGHVGFHGRGSAIAWHDRCAEAFLSAAVSRAAAPSPPPPRHRSGSHRHRLA